ncbi:hypothetical protein ANN_16634 [Periplaneta americana]|uniref:Uncharacterized protein n=1 Tax=Periplaneta americana TaxID=6978 RepID=A0ABQ8SQX8_PERAM|nr:hypothetical protein ANN_16634 [Periplaneta americana]
MAGLCEGGNEPSGSLKTSNHVTTSQTMKLNVIAPDTACVSRHFNTLASPSLEADNIEGREEIWMQEAT